MIEFLDADQLRKQRDGVDVLWVYAADDTASQIPHAVAGEIASGRF
jgi:hypothetical protein